MARSSMRTPWATVCLRRSKTPVRRSMPQHRSAWQSSPPPGRNSRSDKHWPARQMTPPSGAFCKRKAFSSPTRHRCSRGEDRSYVSGQGSQYGMTADWCSDSPHQRRAQADDDDSGVSGEPSGFVLRSSQGGTQRGRASSSKPNTLNLRCHGHLAIAERFSLRTCTRHGRQYSSNSRPDVPAFWTWTEPSVPLRRGTEMPG